MVAHLVWDQVVARSSRVTPTTPQRSGRHRIPPKCLEEQNKRRTFAQPFQNGALDEWLSQRSAKPCTAVRIRQAPLHKRTRQHNGILFLRMPLFLYPPLNPQREPPKKDKARPCDLAGIPPGRTTWKARVVQRKAPPGHEEGDPDIYSTLCKKPERGEERRNRHTDSRNQADVMGKNGK